MVARKMFLEGKRNVVQVLKACDKDAEKIDEDENRVVIENEEEMIVILDDEDEKVVIILSEEVIVISDSEDKD